ncbi:MAG: hypothetical protein K2O41_03510 [Clostridia bacterium]|nr:hypothetical protein [Clostridia bacterium]
MKSFKWLVICLLMILSVGVITLFGCSEKIDCDYFVIYGSTATERYSDRVISSTEELQEFTGGANSEYFEKYGEKFFEDNKLVFINVDVTSLYPEIKVTNVKLSENTLEVTATAEYKGFTASALGVADIVLELGKDIKFDNIKFNAEVKY